jgi:hypothetical protein
MTLEQLRATYTVAYRIILRHRAAHPDQVTDMDTLLELLTDLKDELKKYIATEQPALINVPRKGGY